MSKRRLFVSNFPYSTTEQDLRELFAPRNITDVRIITDRDTGHSRGFGFVEFASDADASDALSLNGVDLGGRKINVAIANERPQRNGHRGQDRSGRGHDRRGNHGWD